MLDFTYLSMPPFNNTGSQFVKRVGILYHPMIEAAGVLAEKLREFIAARGISAWSCSAWEGEKARAEVKSTDLIISVGGDGTILRAAQAIAPGSTPVIGVNLGRLGFMTELGTDEVMDKLPALLNGEGWIDERAMLEAELYPEGEGHGSARKYYCLNDVVVARGATARLVSIEASIDGERLTAYRADGVVMATATGSTGYSLAAGGPILYPQAAEFILLPILPHLSMAYKMVLPSTAVVKLRVSTTHQATLSIDGHINLPLPDGAVITVKHSSSTIRFIRLHPGGSFYSSLEQRLKGKH